MNIQTGKIILIDHSEVTADGHGSYLKIYGMGGETYRVSEKRAKLWDVFRNARQWQPVLAIFETYNKVEYIADARDITDDILKGAISKLGQQVVDKTSGERNRSTALSYSKDLVVAGKIDLDKMIEQAKTNYEFIKESIND